MVHFVICAFYLDFKNSSRVVFLGLSTLCTSGPWQVLLGTKVRGLYGGGQRDNRRTELRTMSSFLSRIFELLPQLRSPRTSWRVWSGKNNTTVTPSTLLRLKLAVCMAPGPAWLLLALVDTLGIFCAVSPPQSFPASLSPKRLPRIQFPWTATLSTHLCQPPQVFLFVMVLDGALISKLIKKAQGIQHCKAGQGKGDTQTPQSIGL